MDFKEKINFLASVVAIIVMLKSCYVFLMQKRLITLIQKVRANNLPNAVGIARKLLLLLGNSIAFRYFYYGCICLLVFFGLMASFISGAETLYEIGSLNLAIAKFCVLSGSLLFFAYLSYKLVPQDDK